jgi:hypothetical protein
MALFNTDNDEENVDGHTDSRESAKKLRDGSPKFIYWNDPLGGCNNKDNFNEKYIADRDVLREFKLLKREEVEDFFKMNFHNIANEDLFFRFARVVTRNMDLLSFLDGEIHELIIETGILNEYNEVIKLYKQENTEEFEGDKENA